MRARILSLLITNLLIVLVSFSQVPLVTKKSTGDTISKRYYNALLTKLNLQDLRTSQDDFNFRFSDYGLLVDIRRKDNVINGEIVNYRFWRNRQEKKRDTVFQHVDIPIQHAEEIYNYIGNTGVLTLPTDKDIKGWRQGMDGLTYTFEQADKKNYSFRSYWTPSAQDSLKEALIVQNFVDTLYRKLNLKAISEKFVNSLPHKGCYTSGGMSVMCYSSSYFEAGYLGSVKFPVGYRLAYNNIYVGKFRTGIFLNLQHHFNHHRHSDLSLNVAKAGIFTKRSDNDFLYFNYRNRNLNISGNVGPDENYKLFYGRSFKMITLGLGADYLSTNGEKTGGLIYASKWFNRPKINIVSSSSIFEDQIDYKAEVLKSVYFNSRSFVKALNVGFNYESFRKVGNAGVIAYVSL